jgi:lysophospholipase L1-like esterase
MSDFMLMRRLGARGRIVVMVGIALASLVTGVLIGKYNAFPLSVVSAWRNEAKPKSAATTTEHPKDPAPFVYLAQDADVVVVGDSLAAGVKWKEVFPHLSITARAVAGSTVEDLLAAREQVQALTPDVVLILVGINDLRWKVPPDTFVKRLSEYASFFGPNTRVIVQSILPVRDPDRWPGINDKVQSVNQALQKWCDRSGFQFIDLRPALAPRGYLDEECSLDGVHLTGEGIRRWMDTLKQSGVMDSATDDETKKADESD